MGLGGRRELLRFRILGEVRTCDSGVDMGGGVHTQTGICPGDENYGCLFGRDGGCHGEFGGVKNIDSGAFVL